MGGRAGLCLRVQVWEDGPGSASEFRYGRTGRALPQSSGMGGLDRRGSASEFRYGRTGRALPQSSGMGPGSASVVRERPAADCRRAQLEEPPSPPRRVVTTSGGVQIEANLSDHFSLWSPCRGGGSLKSQSTTLTDWNI